MLKKTNGKFSQGDMDYWPNELARIRIPVEDRMELAQVFDAPYLADGATVRVVGLWSRKKEPFRCWPVGCPMTHYPYMLSHGHQRGVFIKPEWLERLGPGSQDKVFLATMLQAVAGLARVGLNRRPQQPRLSPTPTQVWHRRSRPVCGVWLRSRAGLNRLRRAVSMNRRWTSWTPSHKHKGITRDMDMDMMLVVNEMNELYAASGSVGR
ncbi:hypothetical protein [Stenotrophomonas phage CM2]